MPRQAKDLVLDFKVVIEEISPSSGRTTSTRRGYHIRILTRPKEWGGEGLHPDYLRGI